MTQKLGAGYLSINLVSAGGQYGSKLFRFTLKNTMRPIEVPTVLSEGEYRCIALAGFLTELATSISRSALVFDDPVCSLDHQWQRRFAERLVEEAASRQVIVFTHDIVFLFDLVEMCEQKQVRLVQAYLQRGDRACGICMDGVPWVAMNVGQRIGKLREECQRARTIFRRSGYNEYEPLGKHIYGLLRETWERAIEEILLNKVVIRFGRSIQTQRLRAVTDISAADIDIIDRGMTKCSRFFAGHDQPGAVNEPVPEPEEVSRDIDQIERWVQAMRRRGRS